MNDENDVLRKRYLSAKKGDLTSYAGMIGEEFSSKINRLAQILGLSHELSVGEYKETLLRECISKFIPKRYSVGRGFIVFVDRHNLSKHADGNIDLLNLKEHRISQQLDILVFDDNNYSPIFRDREFVILRPESVRAIIEVKGFLTTKGVRDSIKKIIVLSKEWNKYTNYIESWGREELKVPGLYLMSWDVQVNKKGNPQCDGEKLRKTIISTYRKNLTPEEFKLRKQPLLNAAYIYNDCSVDYCSYGSKDGVVGEGYSTSRGKFIRYDEKGNPFLDRDSTISRLLASIHINLDTPFNPDFSYFDQSITTSVFPHKFDGITDWDTGKDVDL